MESNPKQPKNPPTDKLPDVLSPNLDIVFVGTAAGKRSAQLGAYYAGPGNLFWKTLYSAGFTTRLYEPHEFRTLTNLGFGLTDMCKTQAGMDREIDDWDTASFARKIREAAPRTIAFTSKKAASVWYNCPTGAIAYGQQPDIRTGFPTVFVLPSPAGTARGYWDETPWHELHSWWMAGSDNN